MIFTKKNQRGEMSKYLTILLGFLIAPTASFVVHNMLSFTGRLQLHLSRVYKAESRFDPFRPIRMAGGEPDTASMKNIYSVLCDSPAELQTYIKQENGEGWADGLGALILFSLGFEASTLQDIAAAASSKGAVVLYADCYGIIGYSPKSGRNIELMARTPELILCKMLSMLLSRDLC
jgi:hypothetical protein